MDSGWILGLVQFTWWHLHKALAALHGKCAVLVSHLTQVRYLLLHPLTNYAIHLTFPSFLFTAFWWLYFSAPIPTYLPPARLSAVTSVKRHQPVYDT